MPASRVRVAPVEGAAELFTPEFTDFLLALHDRLGGRVHDLIAERASMLARAHAGTPPAPLPPSPATTEDWRGPPGPAGPPPPRPRASPPPSRTTPFPSPPPTRPPGA